MTEDNNIRYHGFLSTPSLWKDETDSLIRPFHTTNRSPSFNIPIPSNLMLGKRMERFFSYYITTKKNHAVLIENLQVNQEKLTIGEIDFIIDCEGIITHIELVYKFYLLDQSIDDNSIKCWIGPNRKDRLADKLNKLANHQLPLLKHPITEDLLIKKHILTENIEQKVCFKAQLFLPFNEQNEYNGKLNSDCIYGFWFRKNEILSNLYRDYKFYIPNKQDWVVIPHPNISWLNFKTFKHNLSIELNEQKSPMCWYKSPKGTIQKCFVVWW